MCRLYNSGHYHLLTSYCAMNIVMVFAHSGCYNKILEAGWLVNNNLFLTVLGWKVKIMISAGCAF